jgi:beta-phosphoglucomutase family hydrolase
MTNTAILTSMKAIIFDCDGTLADTMPAHYEAWTTILARYELELDEDRFYSLGGWPTEKIVALLAKETGRALSIAAVAQEKEVAFQASLHHVQPIEKVVAVVREHHGKLPLAVATGAFRTIAEKTLTQIGLVGVFDTLVSCEDVTRHKPEPDVFLEAARRLGIAPADCLVYEDTDPGIEAARRAGMKAVDVRSFYTPRRVTARANSHSK